MGLREITMKHLLVSDNYLNNLLIFDPMILLHLKQGLWKELYLSLISLIMERQFLIAVPFIFPFSSLVKHWAALFLNLLSTVLHYQPLHPIVNLNNVYGTLF